MDPERRVLEFYSVETGSCMAQKLSQAALRLSSAQQWTGGGVVRTSGCHTGGRRLQPSLGAASVSSDVCARPGDDEIVDALGAEAFKSDPKIFRPEVWDSVRDALTNAGKAAAKPFQAPATQSVSAQSKARETWLETVLKTLQVA